MNIKAFRDLLARAGWTAAQAGLGVFTASEVADAVSIPSNWQWAITGIAAGLSALKSIVASRVGDPTTVTFAGPLED